MNDFKILECKKCKHKWISRIAGTPLKCPGCQTKDWQNTLSPLGGEVGSKWILPQKLKK